MKVVVCVKQVIDVTVPLEIDEARKGVVEDGLFYMLNPADCYSLEEALRLKERFTEGEVITITVGPPRARDILRECLGMGADRALHLCDPVLEGSDAFATAAALAQAIRSIRFDLILCGSHSLDEGSAQVGPIIAELLCLPQVSGVTHLEILPEMKKAVVHRKLDRGDREVLECQLPAVLSVEPGLNEPRYPSLSAWIEGLQKHIQVLDAVSIGLKEQDVGQKGSLTKVVNIGPPRPRPKKTVELDGLSPAERIRLLQSGGVSQRETGGILQGDAGFLAEEILRFLRASGFRSRLCSGS